MGKATHTLAMAAMALTAAATIGVGPAAASAPAVHATKAATQNTANRVQTRTLEDERRGRYYRTRSGCHRAGGLHIRRGEWDNYRCERVRRGQHRGWWVLEQLDDIIINDNNNRQGRHR
jgi:hypothetical protein